MVEVILDELVGAPLAKAHTGIRKSETRMIKDVVTHRSGTAVQCPPQGEVVLLPSEKSIL